MTVEKAPKSLGAPHASADRVARAILAEATEIVVETVERHRARGLAEAHHLASRELGIIERRVRQYWHREVSADAVKAWEIALFRAARDRAMRREMAEAEHRAAVLRVQLGEGPREELDAGSGRMGDGPCRLAGA